MEIKMLHHGMAAMHSITYVSNGARSRHARSRCCLEKSRLRHLTKATNSHSTSVSRGTDCAHEAVEFRS